MAMWSDCLLTAWSPTIVESLMMSWVTVTVYFLTAMQAGYVAGRVEFVRRGDDAWKNRVFWLLLTGLLVVLGLNKQFDLQSYVTAGARCSARVGGWYEDRHQWQILFMLSIGGAFIYGARPVLRYFRGHMSGNWWAMVGASFLLAFVLLRASSFHDFDSFINYTFNGVRMNWVVEISGILLISFQSMVILIRQKSASGELTEQAA